MKEFAGCEPLYGLKTGLNEAYLIDSDRADSLVAQDPRLAEMIRPYLRGQDVGRWAVEDSGLRMIVLRSSDNHPWPWAEARDPEAIFQATHPTLHAHLKAHEAKLRARTDQGRYWWELRSCAYYEKFEQPKIVYQEIQFHPRYALNGGFYGNNKVFFLPTDDLYLLGVLNSPLAWWYNWRYLPHMKDEALTPAAFKMVDMPIAEPPPHLRAEVNTLVARLIALTMADQEATHILLDWLRGEHGIDKPGTSLEDFGALTYAAFEAEVKKRRAKAQGSLKPAHVQGLREAWQTYGKPTAVRRLQSAKLEAEVARLVEQAYGLTADDVRLLWQTAPPRMPGVAPGL